MLASHFQTFALKPRRSRLQIKMPAHLCGYGFVERILGQPVGTLRIAWHGLIIERQISHELCTVGGTPILGCVLDFKDSGVSIMFGTQLTPSLSVKDS